MAKLAGGALGVRRGKVGAEVYSVTGGIQVVKQYQPVVANPNTEGQQIQRLKMMVVGKITKVITPAMLVGLGSRFRARAEFNGTMLHAAQARLSGETGEWKAAVPAIALQFSHGEVVDGVAFGPASLTNSGRAVQVSVESYNSEWPILRLIAVAGGRLLDISNDFMAAQVVFTDLVNRMREPTTAKVIPMPGTITKGVNVYAVFGRAVQRAAQLDRNGGSVTEEDFYLDGATTPTTAGIEWSESIWVDWVGAEGD